MITVDWPTSVINVPQSYLTPLGGTDYQLDTVQLWDDLRELEASDDGRAWSFTVESDPPATLDGIPFVRRVTILAPYTLSFEDTGTPYRVLFAGTNNNIQSRTNLIANVSTASSNSAGLVQVTNPDVTSVLDRLNADEELHADGTWELLEAGTANVLATKTYTEDVGAGTRSLKE